MLNRAKLFLFFLLMGTSVFTYSDSLCFSPVKEKEGDKGIDRKWWQSFDYKIQIDDGPIIKPSESKSTAYEYSSELPLVKIWLGKEIVQSFKYQQEWLNDGRTCVYFKALYETWSVVEKWQAEKLCTCSE